MKKHLLITLALLSTASLLQAKGFDPLTADDAAFTRKITKLDDKASRPEYQHLLKFARARIDCLAFLRHLKSPLKIYHSMGTPLENFSSSFKGYQQATKEYKKEKKNMTLNLLTKQMDFLTEDGELSEYWKVSGNGIKVVKSQDRWSPLQITTTTEDGRLSFEIPQVFVGQKFFFTTGIQSSKPIQAIFPSDDSLPSTLYPRPADPGGQGGTSLGAFDELGMGFTVSSRQSPAVFSLLLPKENVLALSGFRLNPSSPPMTSIIPEKIAKMKAYEALDKALNTSRAANDKSWELVDGYKPSSSRPQEKKLRYDGHEIQGDKYNFFREIPKDAMPPLFDKSFTYKVDLKSNAPGAYIEYFDGIKEVKSTPHTGSGL